MDTSPSGGVFDDLPETRGGKGGETDVRRQVWDFVVPQR